jgi:hypothetical protein
MQKRELFTVAALTMALSVMPIGFSAPAHACEPEPCDPPPMEIPWFCKLSPNC